MSDDPCKMLAQAARELLDVHDREPELFRRLLPLMTPENIETLRELATWDDEDPPCPT